MTPDDDHSLRGRGPATRGLAPWLLLLILVAATLFVWHQQVGHQRSLRYSHSKDVAFQASRRLEIFVESRLVVAEVFSERWSTHERRDYSRRRFSQFAAVLLQKISGFHAVWLVQPDRKSGWVAPQGIRSVVQVSELRQWQVFEDALRSNRTLLSAPIDAGKGATSFIAVTPLRRQGSLLGYLVVEFDANALFGFCFHENIRSEFSFRIQDGGRMLYQYSPVGFAGAPTITSREFNVRNRSWRMSVSPRARSSVSYTSSKNLLTLLFGLLLSFLVSGLFALFTRQAKEKRKARKQASEALMDKAEAQSALQGTEARYRSVFGSASDGLVVLTQSGSVVDVNQAAARMHGYDPEKLIGEAADVLIEDSHRPMFAEFLSKTRTRSSARIELIGVTENGVPLDVEIRGNLFDDSDASHMLLVVRDVTERKIAERRLALLSRKVLMAQEEERARVARDLHDELGQIITALWLEIDVSRRQLAATTAPGIDAFHGPVGLIEKATAELSRICEGLRPPLLDDLGVGPAVEQLLANFSNHFGMEISTELEIDPEVLVSNDIALSAYRILQEATTNIARHSGATQVTVSLHIDASRLLLTIYDNGVGFDQKTRATSRGSGIVGMEERAHLVDGQLRIRSVRDEGTRVVLELPIAAPMVRREP